MRLKEMLHKEIEEIVSKGELPTGSIETIEKILDAIKDCNEIMDKSDVGYSQLTYMPIYRNEYDPNKYAYDRNGNSYAGRYDRMAPGMSNRYSYGNSKEMMMNSLMDMRDHAKNAQERETLERAMEFMR